jgi:S-formylglutathione hydrolase FrmB
MHSNALTTCLTAGLIAVAALLHAAEDEPPTISKAAVVDGVRVHAVRSALQASPTEIRVLLPDRIDQGKRYPVIYVLPVEAGRESRYGDGLKEVRKHDLHNKHDVVFVAPTFAALPWCADHPTDKTIAQESYFLQVVVPAIDATYPVAAERAGRLLLGFSKSGWGAWSLLLRHPDQFARAVAWDAPLMMQEPGRYGSGPVFGTSKAFAPYRISDLLRARAKSLAGQPRLILTGYGGFHAEHQQARALLEKLKIPHVYRDGPQRKHDWHSGWVPEAVELLLGNQARSAIK